MRRILKIFSITITIVVFIVIGLIVRNRYSFGVWNPFRLPERIQCYNRRYYISTFSPKILNENEKPVYTISTSDNRTGKDLYTKDPKSEYVPIVIYLRMKDGKYQTYELSGGP